MQGKAVCLGNGSPFSTRFYTCLDIGDSLVYVVGYLGGFDGNFLWNRIGAGKSCFSLSHSSEKISRISATDIPFACLVEITLYPTPSLLFLNKSSAGL